MISRGNHIIRGHTVSVELEENHYRNLSSSSDERQSSISSRSFPTYRTESFGSRRSNGKRETSKTLSEYIKHDNADGLQEYIDANNVPIDYKFNTYERYGNFI